MDKALTAALRARPEIQGMAATATAAAARALAAAACLALAACGGGSSGGSFSFLPAAPPAPPPPAAPPPAAEGPMVRQTTAGKIEGVDDSASSGTWFWKGVPFAQPPVG